MRFLFDESADFRLARYLTHQGHDVTAISIDYPQALNDTDVLALAYRERRILVTRDRDFGELVIRRRSPNAGVILLRLGASQLSVSERWMDRIIVEHPELMHQLLVVNDRGLRVRYTGPKLADQ